MEMLGYKVLDKDHKNRYGKEFVINQNYHVDGDIRFGTNGLGYHFCLNFEDSLKYTEKFTRDFTLARIKASGDIKESFDRYNGVFNIFVASDLEVLEFLTKEEIFSLGLDLCPDRVKRFLQLYPLTEEEKIIFKKEYKEVDLGVMKTFSFYQEQDKGAFMDPYKFLDKSSNGYVKLKKWR